MNNFQDRTSISSPLEVSGKVDTKWIFEGIFPIEIRTDAGELVAEGFGSADIFDADGNIIEGLVEFSAKISYDTPNLSVSDLGVVRFAADPTGLEEGQENQQDMIDVMVIFN